MIMPFSCRQQTTLTAFSGIPMDKHMVVVEWRPDSEQGFVTMAHNEGLDGDSYYIVH